MDRRPMGVEEEFLLVDPGTGRPRSVASTVLRIAGALGKRESKAKPGGVVEGELWLEQVEVDTHPCDTLDELDAELRRQRESAATLAQAAGADIAALATSPFPGTLSPTPKPRYRELLDHLGATAYEHVKPVLQEYGEWDTVLGRVRAVLARGTGARAQRIAYQRGGLAEVVRTAIRLTKE